MCEMPGKGERRTEGLLDLLPSRDETEVYERSHADAGYRVPSEQVDELEGEAEEVYPYGAGGHVR